MTEKKVKDLPVFKDNGAFDEWMCEQAQPKPGPWNKIYIPPELDAEHQKELRKKRILL